MKMVGKTKVYEVHEILGLGVIPMGVGRLNVFMDATPVFWTVPKSGQCFVTFVKVPACYTNVEVVQAVESTGHALAIEIAQEEVSADVLRAFRHRLRCTEKLYKKNELRNS